MKQGIFTVVENTPLTDTIMRLRLRGDASAITCAGQFADIKIDGFFLRRPFSVYDYSKDEFCVAYKIAGAGTEALSKIQPGAELDVLTGLGNGFDLSKAGEHPLLIGGGSGVSPMHCLAKQMKKAGLTPTVILGFNTADEVYCENELLELGVELVIATADGSRGVKGFATAAMKDLTYSSVYSCGPVPMMKAIDDMCSCEAQYSFEARMGCGYGACMGCTCKTENGYKRICKDGPVLRKGEILWEQ